LATCPGTPITLKVNNMDLKHLVDAKKETRGVSFVAFMVVIEGVQSKKDLDVKNIDRTKGD